MNEKIIEVSGLEKGFGDIKAVSGLSFEVRRGEIFGLIGPDGAGKTTTLRILSGIMKPASGNVSVLGMRLPESAEGVKEDIGYMSQKFNLYGDLTVKENIEFFADIFQIERKALERNLETLLRMTRLEPFMERLAGKLSGGMKQKLALICTLIHRPKILLLDEPTTGVDPVSRREFWQILQQILFEGVSIVVSTPYMDEAEWCTRIGLMFGGKMISCDTPTGLKAAFRGVAADVFPAGPSADIEARLKSAEGLTDMQLLGRKFHAVFGDENQLKRLTSALGADAEVKQVPASIEDVFISRMSV